MCRDIRRRHASRLRRRAEGGGAGGAGESRVELEGLRKELASSSVQGEPKVINLICIWLYEIDVKLETPTYHQKQVVSCRDKTNKG